MKYVLLSALVALTVSLTFAQSDHYNVQKGYIAKGYDVVSYFDSQAEKGSDDFVSTHDGVQYKFASKSNQDKFDADPEAYIPQYGGYCAYAIGSTGEKVTINPETFEIRDGKLYLFYNKLFTNTYDKWIDEGAEVLKAKADKNWDKIVNE